VSTVNLGRFSVTENSYRRARSIVESKSQGSRKTATDVLNTLREMKPGWTISTTTRDWSEGVRNIAIDNHTLNQMAEDPEAFIRYKALILDYADSVPAIEQWKEENPGQSLQFSINGTTQALVMIRTLMGGDEARSTFELPSDGSSWSDIITQKLQTLSQNPGERSWTV